MQVQRLGQDLNQDQGMDKCFIERGNSPVSPASYMGLGQKWSSHPDTQLLWQAQTCGCLFQGSPMLRDDYVQSGKILELASDLGKEDDDQHRTENSRWSTAPPKAHVPSVHMKMIIVVSYPTDRLLNPPRHGEAREASGSQNWLEEGYIEAAVPSTFSIHVEFIT